MGATQFLDAFEAVYSRLRSTQMEAIHRASVLAADAIESDRFAVIFGSGHSFIPTMDMFPRIGSYPGWMPIHEMSTSYIPMVLGNQGLRQALYVEKIEGFGRVVMQNYRLDPRDVVFVISNSGVNSMGIDVALAVKEQGVKTVAITSVAHSSANNSRHSSGKRLFEVCDQVIDTCVPPGDALVTVPGFRSKIAPVSTIASCIVMQCLSAETAGILADRGYRTPVLPCINIEISPEQHAEMERMAGEWYDEQARRAVGFFK